MLDIFVHRASELLTDSEPHGDGLICFSLLAGLARRGYRITAFTDRAAIREGVENLTVEASRSRSPIHSLAPWEQSWKAERWMRRMARRQKIDLVWRMHPYGGLPHAIPTNGAPLVVGPLFEGWPSDTVNSGNMGKPRFGIGLGKVVEPALRRGWERTLQKAGLIICSTPRQTARYQARFPEKRIMHLPVIVDLPRDAGKDIAPLSAQRAIRLIFVANLVAYKNPKVFCETIQELKARGVLVDARIVGDGPERTSLEDFCRREGLQDNVKFLGKIANERVLKELEVADLLISASRGEPYGRSIVEAMTVGTPCVCHRSGGPSEFIDHAVDGILVENIKASDYVAAVVECLAEGTFTAMCEKAREKARSWSSRSVLDLLENEFAELTNKSWPLAELKMRE